MGVEKYYNENGEVAVLVSPGYGAGWSTWGGEYTTDIMFDKRIVEKVLDEKLDEITPEFVASIGYEHMYLGGAGDLTVVFLPPGTPFRIDEFDGSESLVTEKQLYYVA